MNTKENIIVQNALYIAWAIAFLATVGSLYFSEILNFIPCELCWYQRIFMYPLVVILGIAAVKNDVKQVLYVLPLSILGLLIAIYHYMLEKIPALADLANSCSMIPCNYEYINYLGFITIPFLSLVSFLLITVLCFVVFKTSKR